MNQTMGTYNTRATLCVKKMYMSPTKNEIKIYLEIMQIGSCIVRIQATLN
jgi:hypothetical protein